MSPPALQQLPAGIASPADYRGHARDKLDPPVWAYLDGGAADQFTARENELAWPALRLLPRVLQPMEGGETRLTLLGRTLAHPLIVAPMAYQRLAHPDGELATAHAAAAQGAGLVVSTQASTPLETVAAAVAGDPGRGPLWFQLYQLGDRALTAALAERAEAAGYEALVLTVDAPVQGPRDAQQRLGFRLPPHIRAVNLPGPLSPPTGETVFEQLFAAPTWKDVEWLARHTRLPVLLKGILHPQDARQALSCGAAGVIVSNHGGRVLDTVPATAELLPAIADALGGAAPVLVDGGIRRGTDVLKAVALGADAVLVGRPILWALAAAGAMGVAHALRLLRDELEIAMALCGCRCLEEAPTVLYRSHGSHSF